MYVDELVCRPLLATPHSMLSVDMDYVGSDQSCASQYGSRLLRTNVPSSGCTTPERSEWAIVILTDGSHQWRVRRRTTQDQANTRLYVARTTQC